LEGIPAQETVIKRLAGDRVTFVMSRVTFDLSPETYDLSPEINQMSHVTYQMSRVAFKFHARHFEILNLAVIMCLSIKLEKKNLSL
jgi:hypothetical protein